MFIVFIPIMWYDFYALGESMKWTEMTVRTRRPRNLIRVMPA